MYCIIEYIYREIPELLKHQKMKNINLRVKIFPTFIFLFSVLLVKAELPSLELVVPTELPQTFSYEGVYNGYIDIDGDEMWDYHVWFTGSYPGSKYFSISGYSGNSFLKNTGIHRLEILPGGTSIGSAAPSGTEWYSSTNNIAFWDSWVNPPTSTHADGINQGYLGLYFNGMYGWLNVEIDDANQTVTLKSSGYNETSGEPATAGLGDPFASTVPVPFIASALVLLATGAGVVWRRKRKK